MILIVLGVRLKFILTTLKEVNLSIEEIGDVEFSKTLDTIIFNLDNLINQLEDLFEKSLELEILEFPIDEEDLAVQPSYQQCLKIQSLLSNLNKALTSLNECKVLHDLSVFNKLIKCASLVEISLFELKKEIDEAFQ